MEKIIFVGIMFMLTVTFLPFIESPRAKTGVKKVSLAVSSMNLLISIGSIVFLFSHYGTWKRVEPDYADALHSPYVILFLVFYFGFSISLFLINFNKVKTNQNRQYEKLCKYGVHSMDHQRHGQR